MAFSWIPGHDVQCFQAQAHDVRYIVHAYLEQEQTERAGRVKDGFISVSVYRIQRDYIFHIIRRKKV